MLIKLESDIRQHIRVEQQLKLHIEQLQNSSDDMLKELQHKCGQIKLLTENTNSMED